MVVGQSNQVRSWSVFLIVGTAVFMTNLDLWIVNVALDVIGRDLQIASLASLSWVLNAYAVTLAALLVVAGRSGDRLGSRRVFLAGMALFTAASALCALAPSLPLLVAARVLQAAGAALLLPTSLALMLAAVPAERRIGAARGWAAVGGLAAASGPVVGGFLVEASWRWVFLVNVPVGLLAVLVGARVLPHPPAREREPVPDLLGSALLTVAVAAVSGALVQAPEWGWGSTAVLALFAVALLSAGAFAVRCARHPAPLVEPALLRSRRFTIANAALFAFSVAFSIMLLSNALWCQQVWGWSPLRTGLAMVPGPALVPIVTVASRRLVQRIGPGRVAVIGSVLFAVAMLWRVVFAGVDPFYVRDLLPSMVLGGIGVGLALGTLMAIGATALPPERSATGSAVVNTGRQIAASVGVALLVTLLTSVSGGESALAGYQRGWAVAAVLALVAAVVSLALADSEREAPIGSTEPSVSSL